MSVQAKIIIDDKEINVLWFSFGYHKNADSDGKPTTLTAFLGLRVAIETQKTLNLARWAFAPNQTKQIELHIYPVLMGGRTRKIKLYDCHLLKWNNRFRAEGTQPMHEILHISAGGVKDNNSRTEYSAPWRKTFDVEYVEPTKPTEDRLEPEIKKINWIHPETKETIKETSYNENVALLVEIENHETSSATITITKKDGTEFKNGQKELTFQETVDEDGVVEITNLEIKEQWEDFKTSNIDELIATVEHDGVSKKSGVLQITPRLKFIAHLQRNPLYEGEYGFDWMREDYKTVCQDYEKLKKEYTPTKIEGVEYFTPWLAMFPNQKGVDLNLKIITLDNTEAKDDDIIKLPSKDGITFKPNELKVSDADSTVITVTCDKPLTKDITIDLLDKNDKTVGKINVFKNANHEQLHFNITPVRILRKGLEESDKNSIENQIDKGFGDKNKDLAGDLKNLENYLNKKSLNQALLQCEIGKVYDVVIDESKWIADDLIIDEGCAFKGSLLDKFEIEFKKQHPKAFKERGITVFLSPLENVGDDGTGGAGGYANVTDVDSKNLAIFITNLDNKDTFAHEIAHIAGLEHSFKEDNSLTEEEVLNRNRVIYYVDDKINAMLKGGNTKEEISDFWKEWKKSYRISREELNIYYRNPYKFKKGMTDNFMDYDNTREAFWKFQWKALQDDVIKFYKIK